jgi:HEAT repeat protein
MARIFKNFIMASVIATTALGCASGTKMKTDRSQLINQLEGEMASNTQWLRIHAAEGLLDNGESLKKVFEQFQPEADTATAPYRIGVWRVLARSTTGAKRETYIGRIRQAMRDPQATDRISAAESLGKVNAASRADRDLIFDWLKSADDATAPFPQWLLVLSSNTEERLKDEAALAKYLSSPDPVARIRAGFAIGRLENLAPASVASLREQLKREPMDSIARIYLITALLLHSNDPVEIARLENDLNHYAHGKANEQLELGIVTGRRGKKEGLSMLAPLLNDPEPDARIGAANGMLRLLK